MCRCNQLSCDFHPNVTGARVQLVPDPRGLESEFCGGDEFEGDTMAGEPVYPGSGLRCVGKHICSARMEKVL